VNIGLPVNLIIRYYNINFIILFNEYKKWSSLE